MTRADRVMLAIGIVFGWPAFFAFTFGPREGALELVLAAAVVICLLCLAIPLYRRYS